MRTIKYVLLIPGLFGLCLGSAFAGWRAVDQDGAVTLLSEGKIRSTEEDGMGIVIDSSKRLVTLFNSEKRIYGSGSAEEFCAEIDAMMQEIAASRWSNTAATRFPWSSKRFRRVNSKSVPNTARSA